MVASKAPCHVIHRFTVLIRAAPLSVAVAYQDAQSAEKNAEEEEDEERDERAGLSAAEGCVGAPEV